MIFVDMAMAVLPVGAYFPQLQIIKQQQSIGSFSVYICAILLISNILRVFFWLTVGFAVNLLFQSLFMIVMQLLLLRECVKLANHTGNEVEIWRRFWKWQSYPQYIKFLIGLTAVMTVVTLITQIGSFGYFGQVIGFFSMTIQAMLGVPQAYSNWSKKSVEGLSLSMIGMWFLGDFAKTIYFIMEGQPFQFVLCGIIQLTVDILIIIQIITYSKKTYEPLKGEKNDD